MRAVIWYALDVQDLPEENIVKFLTDVGASTEGDMTTKRKGLLSEWNATHGVRIQTETRASMLLMMLGRRFGEVSNELEERVRAASIEQLDDWLVRFATASTLAAVFEAD